MPYIDYLDPNRAGDLNFQRQQRTAALDRELGYDIAGYGGNQQRIQARQQQYGRDRNMLNSELDAAGLDPFYDRNRQAFERSRQAAQGLASQASGTAGRDSGQRPTGWVNPALNKPSFAPTMPSDTFAAETTPTGKTWQQPQRPGADYSTAGQNQQPRTDDLARYGGFYNGGKWNAYPAPTSGLPNDRPQQFSDSTAAGRANNQDYLDTLQRNAAQFQAGQKSARQQRLRGSLMTNSAVRNRRTGLTELSTSGRVPTETELAYA